KIKSDAFMGNPAAAGEGADLRATASRPAYQSHSHMDKRMLQRNVYVNTFDPASRRSGKCRLGTYGRELGHWKETAFWEITPVKSLGPYRKSAVTESADMPRVPL